MGYPFREFILSTIVLISQTDAMHRMPSAGIALPISLLRPYDVGITLRVTDIALSRTAQLEAHEDT